MSREPRIVAELGRPETPQETADRKAEASRVYRSSQNVRNLVAALLATLAVVAVIIAAVPRGTPPEREPIDVAAVAEGISASEGRTVITPDMSDAWIVNRAGIEGSGGVRAFTVVYAPADEDQRGFLRVAQGFDDEKEIGRTASRQARHRIQERLFDRGARSNGIEDFRSNGHVVGSGVGAGRNGACSRSNQRRRIGHGANDAGVAAA